MGRYNGHRIPEHYDPEWQTHTQMGEYYHWWHLGYEDGVWQTKWDYGINENVNAKDYTEELRAEVSKLKEENEQLKGLFQANVRILRQKIRSEIEEENKKQVREEDRTTT